MRESPFIPTAEREVVRAAGWYEKEQPGFGVKFIAAAREAAARAVAHPEQGSPYLFGTRRVFLDGFPYSVIYVVRSGSRSSPWNINDGAQVIGAGGCVPSVILMPNRKGGTRSPDRRERT